MVHCGLVFAINNAGTVKMVITPQTDGEYATDRTAAAANNFGVHVRYIHEMVELFEANAIQGSVLPVPATPVVASGGGTGGGGGGGGGDGGGTISADVLTFVGSVANGHEVYFEVEVDTAEILGMADWGGATYELYGSVNPSTLEFSMVDDAPEQNANLPRGYYIGQFNEDGTFYGYYSDTEEETFDFWGGDDELSRG